MSAKDGASEGTTAELLEAIEQNGKQADPVEVAAADRRLDELLEKVELEAEQLNQSDEVSARPVEDVSHPVWPKVQTRTARVMAIDGSEVTLRVRGTSASFAARLAPGVSRELVAAAVTQGDHVVVECESNGEVFVVGVLQTRIPRELTLKAEKVRIEAGEELLLRAGRGALRIRRDGDVELVGSRISAMSRGLFRLVGRVLRLN